MKKAPRAYALTIDARPYVFISLLIAGMVWAASARAAALPEVADLAEQTGSSVVNISTMQKAQTPQTPGGVPGFSRPGDRMDEFFDQFFGRRRGPAPRPQPTKSLGSGFIISADGYIVTNNHVVENADKITVTLREGGKGYPAEVIGQDPETDIALIKINPDEKLPALRFGDSDDTRVGEWVVAIGNPFGLDHTVTAGIISAKGRVIGAGPYDDFLQTDASINPGNSGGPLLNLDGEVVGINTAIVASGQGIGFAIPANVAKDVLAQLRESGSVRRGLLGVTIQGVDQSTAKALGLPSPQGALVASVTPGGPAENAGLKPGDVIIEFEGENVEDAGDLTRMVGARQPGEAIELTLFRQGKAQEIKVTLDERNSRTLAKATPEQDASSTLGLGLRNPTEGESRSLGIRPGSGLLISEVDPASQAAASGVRPGDVLLSVNQIPVTSPGQAVDIIAEQGAKNGAVLLLLSRQGRHFFITVPVDSQ